MREGTKSTQEIPKCSLKIMKFFSIPSRNMVHHLLQWSQLVLGLFQSRNFYVRIYWSVCSGCTAGSLELSAPRSTIQNCLVMSAAAAAAAAASMRHHHGQQQQGQQHQCGIIMGNNSSRKQGQNRLQQQLQLASCIPITKEWARLIAMTAD